MVVCFQTSLINAPTHLRDLLKNLSKLLVLLKQVLQIFQNKMSTFKITNRV